MSAIRQLTRLRFPVSSSVRSVQQVRHYAEGYGSVGKGGDPKAADPQGQGKPAQESSDQEHPGAPAPSAGQNKASEGSGGSSGGKGSPKLSGSHPEDDSTKQSEVDQHNKEFENRGSNKMD